MILNKIHWIKLLPSHVIEREDTLIDRQRLILFIYYNVAIFLGLIANLLSLTGPQETFNFILNSSYFALVIIFFLAYILQKIQLTTALISVSFTAQVVTTIEMIHAALEPTEYNRMLIVANMALLATNVLFSIVAYLKRSAWFLCAIALGTYWLCTLLSHDESMVNFGLVFTLSFVLFTLMGQKIVDSFYKISEENYLLKKDEMELLHVLRLDKEQIRAYIQLARKEHTNARTASLLKMMDEKKQQNIISNVQNYLTERATQLNDIKKALPELTPSEIEISRLILQGKKLGEICSILNKSESNINSQRTHIRKKLNMNPTDNLYQTLLEHMQTPLLKE